MSLRHLLRRSRRDEHPAARPRLRAELKQPITRKKDVGLMLDNDDRVSCRNEFFQNFNKKGNILAVKSGRRLVEQKQQTRVPVFFGTPLHVTGNSR